MNKVHCSTACMYHLHPDDKYEPHSDVVLVKALKVY
jgi:hypothetical protein